MTEFFTLLESIAPISDGLKEHFLTFMTEREVRKNDFLVKAGAINNNAFFIKKGLIRCFYQKEDPSPTHTPNPSNLTASPAHAANSDTPASREVSLWFLMENDIIASTASYIHQKPGREYMVALEDSTVFVIPFADLNKTYSLFPELNLHGRLITQKYSTLWYTLLGGLRTMTARERYQFLLDYSPVLLQRVPAKYLASYLGINPITLSRIKRPPIS